MKETICLLATIGCCFGRLAAAVLLDENAGIEPMSFRIVGGSETTIEKFPWIVALRRLDADHGAASIISPTRFVSAAHCTVGFSVSDFQLRAGSSFKQTGGQLVQISKIINHPRYYGIHPYENDISILWSQTPLNMVPASVSPIRLPAQSASVATGALALVAGWGQLCEMCPTPQILHYVGVPIESNTQCNANYDGVISDGMLCAGFLEGGRNSCQGDSGGPVTINGTLVGIVSWAKGCARRGFPSVFTRVAFYRNWIDSNV